jgi:FKBP-type peptidyl-prolyl cis-trans isomerase FkpA
MVPRVSIRVIRRVVVCVALALGASGSAGCADSPTAPSNFAPFTQTDLTVGTGGDAVVGKLLTVHYTGWFYNEPSPEKKGPQFETSVGGDPLNFTLGAGQVITGWELGTQGMRVGGLRRLVIPPSLAYGSARNGIIPPNATLIFEIQLLAVE